MEIIYPSDYPDQFKYMHRFVMVLQEISDDILKNGLTLRYATSELYFFTFLNQRRRKKSVMVKQIAEAKKIGLLNLNSLMDETPRPDEWGKYDYNYLYGYLSASPPCVESYFSCCDYFRAHTTSINFNSKRMPL